MAILTNPYSFGAAAPPTSDDFIFTVKTDNTGVSANDEFKIPFVSDGAIDLVVDWGDETSNVITTWDNWRLQHGYPADGTYTITITATTGTIRGFTFSNGGDKLKILNISNWGDFNFTQKNTFYGCTNLTGVGATDVPAINQAHWNFMFASCTNWNGVMNDWDMSGVTLINWMFYGCIAFNQPIGDWDTSNVTNISYMFYYGTAFDQDLSDWDVTAIISSANMNQFMPSATLSTENYDALLIGWDAQSVGSNLSPHFGSSKYTGGGAAAAARANLISSDGWTITDGGIA